MRISTYAVILTHNRHELLKQSVAAISPQVNHLWVIDNASNPPVSVDPQYTLLSDSRQPPNLAELWNFALDEITKRALEWSKEAWNVALLCDDAVVYPSWADTVADEMRRWDAHAASAHAYVPLDVSIRKIDPDSDLHNRMCGWAFMLRGESGLRADERFHWWWCDTDLDWQARIRGGTVIARGPVVPNTLPNDFTVNYPGLNDRAGQDGLEFTAKWGWRPW